MLKLFNLFAGNFHCVFNRSPPPLYDPAACGSPVFLYTNVVHRLQYSHLFSPGASCRGSQERVCCTAAWSRADKTIYDGHAAESDQGRVSHGKPRLPVHQEDYRGYRPRRRTFGYRSMPTLQAVGNPFCHPLHGRDNNETESVREQAGELRPDGDAQPTEPWRRCSR